MLTLGAFIIIFDKNLNFINDKIVFQNNFPRERRGPFQKKPGLCQF